jgi:hypothetical protein
MPKSTRKTTQRNDANVDARVEMIEKALTDGDVPCDALSVTALTHIASDFADLK